MKKSTRILCLLLSALMLVGALAACGGDSKDTTPADTNNSTPGVSDTTGPTSFYEPSGNTYDGADFNILLSSKDSGVVNYFEFAEENPTVIDTAVQKKNTAVEQDYEVKLVTIKDAGGGNTGATRMQQALDSDSLDYHLSYVAAYDAVPLGYQGALYNLNKLDGINLKNEWWDQNANRDLAVNDLLFFTTGDIDAWDDMQQFIMIFNSDLFVRDVKDYTLEEFYKLSSDGKWTYDELYKVARSYTKDIDGTDGMSATDQYGMITWDDTIYATFASSGGKVIENVDGELTLPIFSNQTAQDCMRTYTEWSQQNSFNYSQNGGGSPAIKMFKENRALFFYARLLSLNNFRDMDSNYGLVPIPKYTEDQEYCITCSPYHLNLVTTLNIEEDATMRGEVIESIAYYSNQHLTPAYREKTLEGQSARDDGSLETLAISAGNRIYDLGFYVRPGNITPELIYLYRKWSTEYASMYERVKGAAEMAVSDVSNAYKALANS